MGAMGILSAVEDQPNIVSQIIQGKRLNTHIAHARSTVVVYNVAR